MGEMAFLLREELLETFYTEGSFYEIDLNGMGYKCRGLAKITRKGTVTDDADALFVLVNPGSCQPKDENYAYPPYNKVLTKIPSVQAKSDPTQLQIMRLMERRNWNMAYIINLSDLQTGNFDDFKIKKKHFMDQSSDCHSIFSPNRVETIPSLLSEKTMIIAGWGKNTFIKKRASHALSILSGFRGVGGLPYPTVPYYKHPYPMLKKRCIGWLNDMEAVLNKDECDE